MNYHNIDPNISGITDGLGVPIDNRPKSCCDVSRVPGIKYIFYLLFISLY